MQTVLRHVCHYNPWVLRQWEKAVGIPMQHLAGGIAGSNLFLGTGPSMASCTAVCLSGGLDEKELLEALCGAQW